MRIARPLAAVLAHDLRTASDDLVRLHSRMSGHPSERVGVPDHVGPVAVAGRGWRNATALHSALRCQRLAVELDGPRGRGGDVVVTVSRAYADSRPGTGPSVEAELRGLGASLRAAMARAGTRVVSCSSAAAPVLPCCSGQGTDEGVDPFRLALAFGEARSIADDLLRLAEATAVADQ